MTPVKALGLAHSKLPGPGLQERSQEWALSPGMGHGRRSARAGGYLRLERLLRGPRVVPLPDLQLLQVRLHVLRGARAKLADATGEAGSSRRTGWCDARRRRSPNT